MLIATVAFTVMQAIIKELAHFHVFQIVFFRSIFTALLCMLSLKQLNISLKGNHPKLLFLRAFFGMIGMIFFFVTVQRVPLGASVSLKYLSPIFTAIFAVFLINEKVKPLQWLCFLAAIIGVYLLKGFDTRIDNLSVLLGVIGAIGAGLVYVIIRKIGTRDHSLVIVNYYMLTAAILTGIGMLFFWQTPNLKELFLLTFIGVAGYFGQVYMTKSFQLEPASKVAPLKYMELINSLLVGWIWFGEDYNWLGYIGIFLILGSMILNVLVKNKA